MSEFYVRPNGGIPEGGVCAQADPEMFHPDKGSGMKKSAAKNLCLTSCDVQEECLEGALERKERFGIWGGMTESERRKLGKKAIS